MRTQVKILVSAAVLIFVAANAAGQQFQVMEASISDIHRAMQSGKLTCRSLVQQYLDRINAYDQQGPTLNAMLYVNPKAWSRPMPWIRRSSAAPSSSRCSAFRWC